MIERLQELLKNSYAPYSNFHVAALVELKDGQVFSGVNVENASYGATICAERVAICSAVAAGYRKGDFRRLYVMVDRPKSSTCCFICRQMISEFFDADAQIVLMNQQGEQQVYSVGQFCPFPFSEGDLV